MAALWLVVQFGILHLVISIRKIVRRAIGMLWRSPTPSRNDAAALRMLLLPAEP
ncbi:hypothetical protein [Bradyrhizobium sp. DASA03007]|uniref:hypothetical protein n=1 Tax=unclassified Bradyrhizobium TaxID=2631580 RepID=UPI003F6F60BE